MLHLFRKIILSMPGPMGTTLAVETLRPLVAPLLCSGCYRARAFGVSTARVSVLII